MTKSDTRAPSNHTYRGIITRYTERATRRSLPVPYLPTSTTSQRSPPATTPPSPIKTLRKKVQYQIISPCGLRGRRIRTNQASKAPSWC